MAAQPRPSLLQVFKQGERLTFKKGELIHRADSEANNVYCIERGFVRVYSLNKAGEEYNHLMYKAPEIFPVLWVLPKLRRNLFYTALDAVTVWRIDASSIMPHLEADPVAALFVRQIAQQFLFYADRVDNLEYKYARDRLVYRLLILASRFGKLHNGHILIEIPLTQQMIGSTINLSRENVARELDRLIRKGLVAYEGRLLLILDLKGLQRELPSHHDFNYLAVN